MLRKIETKHTVIAGINARAFSAGTAEIDQCITTTAIWCVSEIIQYWLADRYTTPGLGCTDMSMQCIKSTWKWCETVANFQTWSDGSG